MESFPEAWFPNLGIKIYNLPRVAFSIFGIEIYLYAIFIFIGLVCGLLVAMREAEKTGQNKDLYLDFFLYTFPLAILGARIYYVIFSPNSFSSLFEVFNIRQGGLAIYGGVIVSVTSAFVFSKIKKLNPWVFCDTAILGLILGQAIGRWGNFVNREAFGGYTDSLFALRYLKSQVGYVPQSVMNNIIVINEVEFIQVQPTFLYESVWNFLIFGLMILYKKHKKFNGEILMIYCVGYGIGRVFIERLRTDQLLLPLSGFPVSLAVSAILVLVGIGFITYKRIGLKSNI